MAGNTKKRSHPPRSDHAVMVLAAGVLFASPAHAYLDPGTGSILLQSLLGVIVAATVAGNLFWQRIKSFFSFLFGSRKDGSDDSVKE